ncbi:MAG: LacI family DNA-binding transcriptional regulator [Propioniciclava sp.]|uniref:LacI family DNA-binding transcriptional regulator n=1 Tax=Propioniciclava sp. TaxID=2038686 RepID=UPI0039E57A28
MVRRPTQSDVARVAGVSRGAVSLALSSSPGVGSATRERILRVADELGYVRNLSAASLAGRFDATLGVVLPNLRNPFFEALVAQVQRWGVEADLLPLFVTSLDEPAREVTVMRKLHELRVAGVVVASPVSPAADLVAMSARLPLAVIGIASPGGNVDAVFMDENHAARLVSHHLRARRWRRVLHLSSPHAPDDIWIARRRQALESAWAGLPFAHEAIPPGGLIQPVIDAHDPRNRDEPLAIIAHNDLLATDVTTAVQGLGLVPGRDVAIVSFDDTHMAARPEYNLTSVRQDADALASAALGMLRERGEGLEAPGREVVVTPTLTVRSSS